MKTIHRAGIALALLIVAGAGIASSAQDKPLPAPAGLGFLEAGKDYVIRFPEGSDIFKTSRAGFSETKMVTADGREIPGKPATWNMTLSVNMFQVVRFGGGSWVLLRHPTDADDFLKWTGQRRSKAILAGPRVKEIEAKSGGPGRLKNHREAAALVIPTSETWINLDHAIAIADVPFEEDEPKLTIQSIQVQPSK